VNIIDQSDWVGRIEAELGVQNDHDSIE
jgi:hypothetical protein